MNHAEAIATQWPTHTDYFGESADAVYTSVGGTTTSMPVIINGRPESMSMDVSWEVAAKQFEVFAAISDAPSACTPGDDTITARGEVYTVMERQNVAGAQYRYLCEREDVEAVSLRGRRY
jgi:hypothetical protein